MGVEIGAVARGRLHRYLYGGDPFLWYHHLIVGIPFWCQGVLCPLNSLVGRNHGEIVGSAISQLLRIVDERLIVDILCLHILDGLLLQLIVEGEVHHELCHEVMELYVDAVHLVVGVTRLHRSTRAPYQEVEEAFGGTAQSKLISREVGDVSRRTDRQEMMVGVGSQPLHRCGRLLKHTRAEHLILTIGGLAAFGEGGTARPFIEFHLGTCGEERTCGGARRVSSFGTHVSSGDDHP